MASISNHERPSKNATIWNKEDRISNLPDPILVHILSFLPTKYAVGTSVLSSRWTQLWASIPNLDFDDQLLWQPRSVCDYGLSFMSFVDRVLMLHNLPCIQRFRLIVGGEIDLYRLNTWINFAISRFVQELHIQISLFEGLNLPFKLFKCETLVIFKLFSKVELFDIPDLVSFTSLKILHVSLEHPDSKVTEKLFSSCPVLEDLFIEANMEKCEERIFNIHAPALRSFKIDFFGTDDDDLELSGNLIMLNAPRLEYLTLEDNYLACYLLKNLYSLVKADVNVGDCCLQTFTTKEHVNQVFVILNEIYNVNSLSLGASTMGALDFADDNNNLPLFLNLTHLEVGVANCYGWKRLGDLLHSMPNMVNLVLKENFDHECHYFHKEFNWIEPQAVPICLLLHLKEIIFTGIKGEKDDLELIKYFLENGKVLNKMTIATRKLGWKEENKFLKKLVVFQRGSRTCQIILS